MILQAVLHLFAIYGQHSQMLRPAWTASCQWLTTQWRLAEDWAGGCWSCFCLQSDCSRLDIKLVFKNRRLFTQLPTSWEG